MYMKIILKKAKTTRIALVLRNSRIYKGFTRLSLTEVITDWPAGVAGNSSYKKLHSWYFDKMYKIYFLMENYSFFLIKRCLEKSCRGPNAYLMNPFWQEGTLQVFRDVPLALRWVTFSLFSQNWKVRKERKLTFSRHAVSHTETLFPFTLLTSTLDFRLNIEHTLINTCFFTKSLKVLICAFKHVGI